jgi:hypothetical protein
MMGEIVNLRKFRKQAKKKDEAERAATNRVVHGRSKAERDSDTERTDKLSRYLDGHEIEKGDG